MISKCFPFWIIYSNFTYRTVNHLFSFPFSNSCATFTTKTPIYCLKTRIQGSHISVNTASIFLTLFAPKYYFHFRFFCLYGIITIAEAIATNVLHLLQETWIAVICAMVCWYLVKSSIGTWHLGQIYLMVSGSVYLPLISNYSPFEHNLAISLKYPSVQFSEYIIESQLISRVVVLVKFNIKNKKRINIPVQKLQL
jgi:hypothetical protein